MSDSNSTSPTPLIDSGHQKSRILTILKKEFREIFRDRRTVMSVVISPLIITPALFALMGTLISGQTEKIKSKTYSVGIVRSEEAPQLYKAVQAIPNFKFTTIEENKAENWVKDRRGQAVIILPAQADSALVHSSVPIQILQDPGKEESLAASSRLSQAFTLIGQQYVKQRLISSGLPGDYATPFHITEKQISESGGAGTFILSMMLPYILVVSAFSGAIYAAFDQVAGEKERGTLETLLVSPASRSDIVIGKFLAVVGVCLLSSILSITGLIFSFTSKAKSFAWLSQGGLHLSSAAIGVTLLVMIPLAVLFAGLLLAVSTFARNQKEAQTYLAPLFIFVLMPAMASMFIGTDVGKSIALVPVLNASIIIKQALSGSYDPGFISIAFAASAVYAGIALFIATRLFHKESVLIKA